MNDHQHENVKKKTPESTADATESDAYTVAYSHEKSIIAAIDVEGNIARDCAPFTNGTHCRDGIPSSLRTRVYQK